MTTGEGTAFFYGTLMAPEVLYRICFGLSNISGDIYKANLAASLSITPAILLNHRRHKVTQADYPGIVPDNNYTVLGTYVTGLTQLDMQRLDWFEGSEYSRQGVTVRLLRSDDQSNFTNEDVVTEVQTEAYVFTAGMDRLDTEDWNYEVFRQDKMHHWLRRNEVYVGEAGFPGHCGCILLDPV